MEQKLYIVVVQRTLQIERVKWVEPDIINRIEEEGSVRLNTMPNTSIHESRSRY
jgi:hypothetical protein